MDPSKKVAFFCRKGLQFDAKAFIIKAKPTLREANPQREKSSKKSKLRVAICNESLYNKGEAVKERRTAKR